MAWTLEQLELLRQRWVVEKRSGTYIAEELGVTRNAVMGKVRDLGITRREPRPPKPAIEFRPRKPRVVLGGILRIRVELPPEPEPYIPRYLSLSELEKNDCRWPFEDGGVYTFCGCKIKKGSPYCETHWGESRAPRIKPTGKPVNWKLQPF